MSTGESPPNAAGIDSPGAARRVTDPRGASGSNPFSTRYVRPGAIPYFFPPGEDAQALVARLREQDWRGEIIGPHGSGKSTLLAALLPALAAAGRQPILCTLRDGQRSLGEFRAALAAAGPASIVVIDGFEQLSSWNKWSIRWFCRRRQAGLLVTAHTSAGLPTLATTEIDQRTAREVLGHLLPAGQSIDEADLRQALAQHGGNLREALFELYDLYELRRPRSS